MRNTTVTRSFVRKNFEFKPGELIRYYTKVQSGSKKYVVKHSKVFKVLQQYPFMVRCQDFNGHIESFSAGDYYDGTIEKISLE